MFVPGRPFQPSLMFRCSILGKDPCLTYKHYTGLERIARDKHSSKLLTFVNYWLKKFYNIGPWCEKIKPLIIRIVWSKMLQLWFCFIPIVYTKFLQVKWFNWNLIIKFKYSLSVLLKVFDKNVILYIFFRLVLYW